MGARKSKSDDVELQQDLVNGNQETSPNHFQVDADFFDLSDPEKQKSADEEKRLKVELTKDWKDKTEAKNLFKDIGYEKVKNHDSTKRKVEDLKLPPEWTEFRFRICQRACMVPERGAHVTLLHLVILHQDVEMLQRLIKEITEEDLEKGYLKEKIIVKKIPKEFLVEDDRWLFEANCLHLASKYFPEGLNLLLSDDKVKRKAKELIDTKTRVDSLMNRTDSSTANEQLTQNKGCFSFCCSKEIAQETQTKEISQKIVEIAPLHIAAKKPNSISTRILLENGANVELEDHKGFTPLFHASKKGSLPNLLELLELGQAKPNHHAYESSESNSTIGNDDANKNKGPQITALVLAKSTEAVQILLNFGAKTSNVLKTVDNKTNIDEFLENHSVETSKIILNECLEEINEDLVVFNFEPFEDLKEDSDEMDLHKSVKKNNRSGLLLHPIMQAFLHLKWKQVKRLYFIFMCFEVAFVVALSFLGYDFVRMTFCSYCGEKYLREEPTDLFHPRNLWADKYEEKVPPYHQDETPLGKLKCFIKSEDNCESEDIPDNCNGDSTAVREKFFKFKNEKNGKEEVRKDFCKDGQNKTEQEDCAKFKFQNEKNGKNETRKDFCKDEQNKTEQEDCAQVKFENGSIHLVEMEQDYLLNCHKYFLRTCRRIGGTVDCSKPYRLEPICHAEGRSINECWYARQTALALYFFLSVIFFREIQEVIASGPWVYFSSLENLLQNLIMILTASFIAVAPENTEIGTHLAGWAVFCAWVNLTSLLGRIHLFGEYIHMAFNVTKTLLKILMSFIPTFIAFTLTFNILMQSSEVFQSIHNTGFKVFVMMLGEFELTDYFTTQEVSKVGGRNYSVQFLFVLFVIFICVIVMNLLIGLTVSNIDDLKKDADIILASAQIDDIVDMKRKLDYPCIKYMFNIFESLRPEELITKFNKKQTQEKKVYIKLENSKKSQNENSAKPCFLSWLQRCQMTSAQRQLYFYDKIKVEKFPGEISEDIIQSAREALRKYKIDKQNFKEKLATIRDESNDTYNKAMKTHSKSTDLQQIEESIELLVKLVKDMKTRKA